MRGERNQSSVNWRFLGLPLTRTRGISISSITLAGTAKLSREVLSSRQLEFKEATFHFSHSMPSGDKIFGFFLLGFLQMENTWTTKIKKIIRRKILQKQVTGPLN